MGVLFVCLCLLYCSSVLGTLCLFLASALSFGLVLSHSSCLLSLLFLLIYLGGLMVLLAYYWMLMPSSMCFPAPVVFFLWVSSCFLNAPSFVSGSLCFFQLSSSLLLFIGSYLFFTLLVVVYIVDLSAGRFTS